MRRALPLLPFWSGSRRHTQRLRSPSRRHPGAAPFDVTLTATGDAVATTGTLRQDGGRGPSSSTATRPGATQRRSRQRGQTARPRPRHLGQAHAGGAEGRHIRTANDPSRPHRPRARGAPIAPTRDAAVKRGKVTKGRFQFRVRQTRPPSYSVRLRQSRRTPSQSPSDLVRCRVAAHLHARQPLVLHATLKPRSGNAQCASGGGRELRARNWRSSGRARHEARHRLRRSIRVTPKGGYCGRQHTFRRASVPTARGAHGLSVDPRAAPRAALRATRRGTYFLRHRRRGSRFQKVHGLARTGRVTLRSGATQVAHVPFARYGRRRPRRGRQVAPDPSKSGAAGSRVVHVSTGAAGNTPIGRWHFTVGPRVPPSGMFIRPSSSAPSQSTATTRAAVSCVTRMRPDPMWIAPSVFLNSYGEPVLIYH
jgi:hypothetical protein